MKVIEHGNTYNKVTCPHCNCIFEYTLKDTKQEESGPVVRKGAWTIHHEFIDSVVYCPECGGVTIIKRQHNNK